MSLIKSIDGLPFGSIKSVNGLAAAAIKSFNGVEAAAASYADRLFNAPSTITPFELWIAELPYLTLDGSDNASQWDGAWNGNNALQPDPFSAPHWMAGSGGTLDFDGANQEWMDLGAMSLAKGPMSIFVVEDNVNITATQRYLSSYDGVGPFNFALEQRNTTQWRSYDGITWRYISDLTNATGAMYHSWLQETGSFIFRRDGAQIDTDTWTEQGFSTQSAIGSGYDGTAQHLYSHLKLIAIYLGVDAPDTTAIETILAEIKATI